MAKVFVFGMLGLVIIGLGILAGVTIPVIARWWKKMVK
jgi:hypothetical protein